MAEERFQDPDYCEKWSKARGPLGDEFQRYLIKPFIAACAVYLKEERTRQQPRNVALHVRSRYHELLGQIAATGSADPEATIANVAGSALGPLAVMDLGCGEAFLGRWLAALGSQYIGLDYSPTMLEKAKAKAREAAVSTPVELCDLVSASPKELSAFAQKVWQRPHPDLVTATSFLDNIEDCKVLMQKLADWAMDASRSPDFILATLYPFYFRTLSDLEIIYASAGNTDPQFDIHLASTDSDVKAYLRWPLEYERVFADAGFHVLSCIHPDLASLPSDVRNGIVQLRGDRLQKVPKGSIHAGPFVLWLLRPRTRGRLISHNQLGQMAKDSDLLAYISEAAGRTDTPSTFKFVEFQPGTIIEHAGSLGGSCCIVIKGSAVRLGGIGSAPVQTFGEGSIFGEFETGDNATSDRYRDDLAAGPAGCTLIEIPFTSVRELLAPPEASVARALFLTLRARMSQYSWTWTKNSAKGTKQGEAASNRTYDHLARALLFGLSCEAADRRALGPAVLVANTRALQKFIYDDDSTDTFKEGFPQFVSSGVLDAGIWTMRRTRDRSKSADQVVELSQETWKKTVRQTFDLVAGSRINNPGRLQHVIDTLMDHQGSVSSRAKVRQLWHNGAFSSYANEVRNDARRVIRSNEEEKRIFDEWLANLAAIQAGIFSQSASLIFIRDESLLRDMVKLGDAMAILNKREVTNDDAQLMEMSRWVEYSDVTLFHIRSALASRGHFAVTAAKMGFSPDLYETIVYSEGEGAKSL